uniref:F-box protein n=1 Tax=Leersia perrieri TaxID=77586 RepID=A0A0D9VDY1_9ORYZ
MAAGGGAIVPAPSPARSRRLPCSTSAASMRGSNASVSTADRLQLVAGMDERATAPANGRSSSSSSSPPAPAMPQLAVEKLRAIAEAAADKAEMHDIIGRQRDNWNHLLLHSTNSLSLAASALAALAATAAPPPTMAAALKLSAGALLATAAVTMAAVNKIQPSQLAEEQRNATRLWRQLERDLRANLAAGAGAGDVDDAMDRVLALDAAYPLPLLPVMLEKFPKSLSPTRWWPTKNPRSPTSPPSMPPNCGGRRVTAAGNGWTPELEEEMLGLLRVIKLKDEHEYIKVGNLILAINKRLAVAGPTLAGTAAIAAAFITSGEAGTWAAGGAVIGGALAAAVNTVEHGGQVGMVFELCRNVAGIYRKMQEEIEANLEECDVERRENGEVFEMKVALQLGRRTSEMKQFRAMASPAVRDEDIKDFAGKLV